MGTRRIVSDAPRMKARRGLSLVEVIVALSILGGVLLGLGMFSARLAQATSTARVRVTASQLANERIEQVKAAIRYTAIETLFVATEASVPSPDGIGKYSRRTWVTRVGGTLADTIDYKIVTVQVSEANQKGGPVRKTTVIAPF
jgi:prepilin-type N-terminal cleavage/methylation domain-containing protein